MKLWTLVENTAENARFIPEHGLSLYIEACGKRILFDMGGSDAFAINAKALGIDLSMVDVAILSHGHADHGGGLGHFLQCNSTAPVYMSRYAFEPHYNAEGKNIGLDLSLLGSDRIRFVEDTQSLGDGLTLYDSRHISVLQPLDTAGLTAAPQGRLQPEDFRHEQYLLIQEKGKNILISGCSHRGILNIMHRFSPDVLVGGFHYMKMDPEGAALQENARALAAFPALYYTGHCTGLPQYAALKTILGNQLKYLPTGSTLVV